MGLFRRRRQGRHDLGGAVRDIPYAAPTVLVHPPLPGSRWGAPTPAPPPAPAPAPARAPGPHVELGFRDGSTAALAPDSAQSRALVALASVLTRRD